MDEFRTTDPVAVLFTLAEGFGRRIPRFVAIFTFALIAAYLSVPVLVFGALLGGSGGPWPLYLVAGTVMIVLTIVIALAVPERTRVLEFRRGLEMVARASRWTPHPAVPAGQDPLDRFLAFLRTDDRYASRRGATIERPYRRNVHAPRTRADREVAWDCRVLAKGSPFVWGPDAHQVLIRVFRGNVTIQDLETVRVDAEETLQGKAWPLTRVVALAEAPDLTEDAREYAQTARIRYRSIGSEEPRSIPIELVADRPDRTYEQLPLFYVG